MDVAELLIETYGRIPPLARRAVEGLPTDRLTEPPGPGRNTIAWLVWHLARVQDAQVADVARHDQLWTTGDWAQRMDREPDPSDTGYGYSADEVLAVRPPDGQLLLDYLDAVADQTERYLGGLGPSDLDKVVDENWDPPVTLGVRLVSVADDCIQHAGQAAYVRGLLEG